MTPTQIQQVLDKIAAVFPRSELTAEEMQLFGERLDRIDLQVEQAYRVVEQHRFDHDKRSPALSSLLSKLHGAVQRKEQSESPGPSRRQNRLVDLYRSRDGFHPGMSDLDVAMAMGRRAAQQWGNDAGRSHLLSMLREMRVEEVEMWRIAFEQFPDADMQASVRERIVRTSRKYAEMRKRMANKTAEQIAQEAMA